MGKHGLGYLIYNVESNVIFSKLLLLNAFNLSSMINIIDKCHKMDNKNNNSRDEDLHQVNFGFKKVNVDKKTNLVKEIFSAVAPKYDLMNDLMSFGIHRLWKKELCLNIPNLNSTILDVACGSGDIAFRLIERGQAQNKSPHIIMLDINNEMLNQAKNKAIDNNLLENIDFICSDAENLPLADESVDYYVIAFGIRNVTNISRALTEAFRVLKPGGKFLCLEFSQIKQANLKLFYQIYAFNIIPKIGKYIAGNEEAYRYLVESIDLFPDQESFKAMIYEAKFEQVKYQNLNCGIAAIHSAYKI